MILTSENIQEWKRTLDQEFKRQYPQGAEYSQTRTDEDWIKEYEGYVIQDVIDDEVQYWEE